MQFLSLRFIMNRIKAISSMRKLSDEEIEDNQ